MLAAPPIFVVFFMALALFDLDHTLLDGDSNSLWLLYLIDRGYLDAEVWASQATYLDTVRKRSARHRRVPRISPWHFANTVAEGMAADPRCVHR